MITAYNETIECPGEIYDIEDFELEEAEVVDRPDVTKIEYDEDELPF